MSSTKSSDRLTIRLPDELQRKLSRAMARSDHLSVSDLVRDALEAYFDEGATRRDEQAVELNRRLDDLSAVLERIDRSVADPILIQVVSGLIDHHYLPLAPQDRKLPILALQRLLKGG